MLLRTQRMVEEEDVQFEDEYMNDRDPSILHFLLAAGDEVCSLYNQIVGICYKILRTI